MISWGRQDGLGPLDEAGHSAMELTLTGRAWARAFRGSYVIAVSDESDRIVLRDALIAKAKTISAVVLMSPLMTGGLYNGLLPPNLWEPLNSIGKQ